MVLTISLAVVAALEAVFIAGILDRRDHYRELVKARAQIAALEQAVTACSHHTCEQNVTG